MKDTEIRVALIGYGLGGRSFHAPIIAVTPGMRLAAIVTGSAARRRGGAAPESVSRRVSEPPLGRRLSHDQAPARGAGLGQGAPLRVALRALASRAKGRMARARRAGGGGRIAVRPGDASHRPG